MSASREELESRFKTKIVIAQYGEVRIRELSAAGTQAFLAAAEGIEDRTASPQDEITIAGTVCLHALIDDEGSPLYQPHELSALLSALHPHALASIAEEVLVLSGLSNPQETETAAKKNSATLSGEEFTELPRPLISSISGSS